MSKLAMYIVGLTTVPWFITGFLSSCHSQCFCSVNSSSIPVGVGSEGRKKRGRDKEGGKEGGREREEGVKEGRVKEGERRGER